MIRRIRLTEAIVHQLAKIHKPAIEKKIKEYQAKPELLEANLTLEVADKFKDFFKQYGIRLGHFRVSGGRVIGLLKTDVFFLRKFTPRGKLDRELDRILEQFPFDLK